MRKILFISALIVLANSLNFEVEAATFTTIAPLQPPLGYGGNYQYDSYPKITQIEGIIFNRTYSNEDIYSRLDRIESRIFRRTNPNASLSERVDFISQNINPESMTNIPLDNLAKIEYKLFSRSYVNDDPETRVIRLEKEMLGAMQQGELEERYEVVASAAKHYNAFPTEGYGTTNPYRHQYQQPYQQPYIASNNVGGTKGILKNVMSALTGGALTGFTPPMTDQYGYCNSPYMNQSYPQNSWLQNIMPNNNSGYNNYMHGNNGYYNDTRNYCTGSGAHVIYD